MKNLLLIFTSIMFSVALFSQELGGNNFTDSGGDEVFPDHPNPHSTPECYDCVWFDLSFSVTAPIPIGILYDISLDVDSQTGTVSGFDNYVWTVDTITGSSCNIYTYTQHLSICFDIDPNLCDPGEHQREEIVGFSYNVYGNCLADHLNSDPLIDYFDENCLGPNADTCEPYEQIFNDICCEEPEEEEENPGRNNVLHKNNYPTISPNPCLDILNVENLLGGEEITIFSSIGEKLKKITVKDDTSYKVIRDLQGIPTGVNLLRITRDGKTITQLKFVKN